MNVQAASRPQGRRTRSLLVATASQLTGYLFVLPLVAALLAFSYYPMLEALRLSFTNSNGVSGTYVGLSNYKYVLSDPLFWSALYNTVYMGLLSVVFGVILSFIFATLVNSLPFGQAFFKAIYFAPNVTSIIATALVFLFLFYPTDHGLANVFLGWFGIGSLRWFADPRFARLGIVIMAIWHSIGYAMLIWLAGLQSVPRTLYEAADVDGAGKFQEWLYLTIPLLRPIFLFVVVVDTIGSFKRFADVYQIGGTDGQPGGALATLMIYIYRLAFNGFDFGTSTATAFIVFLIIAVCTLVNFRLFRDTGS